MSDVRIFVFTALLIFGIGAIGFVTGWHSARAYYTGGQYAGANCREVFCLKPSLPEREYK